MKINRLMEIIIILINKGSITAKELSERFMVSKRTIYRDIEELSSAGIPVYMSKGKGGGISLLDGYTLNKAMLTEGEKQNIIFALKTLGGVKDVQIQSTLEKLGSIFGNSKNIDWLEIDFSSWGNHSTIDKRFEQVKSSILRERILQFKYINSKNSESNRLVKPYKVMFKGQSWYMVGFCCEKKGIRIFKLTRMREVIITEDIYERTELEDLIELNEKKGDNPEYKPYNVTLKMKFQKDMFFRLIDFYQEEEILKEEDGTYIVTTTFPYDEWIYSHILSYGHKVKLLEPQFIIDELKNRIKNLGEIY